MKKDKTNTVVNYRGARLFRLLKGHVIIICLFFRRLRAIYVLNRLFSRSCHRGILVLSCFDSRVYDLKSGARGVRALSRREFLPAGMNLMRRPEAWHDVLITLGRWEGSISLQSHYTTAPLVYTVDEYLCIGCSRTNRQFNTVHLFFPNFFQHQNKHSTLGTYQLFSTSLLTHRATLSFPEILNGSPGSLLNKFHLLSKFRHEKTRWAKIGDRYSQMHAWNLNKMSTSSFFFLVFRNFHNSHRNLFTNADQNFTLNWIPR